MDALQRVEQKEDKAELARRPVNSIRPSRDLDWSDEWSLYQEKLLGSLIIQKIGRGSGVFDYADPTEDGKSSDEGGDGFKLMAFSALACIYGQDTVGQHGN